MLDTLKPIETPEGVSMELRIAGPAPRALAWALDTLFRYLAYAMLSIPMSALGQFGMGLILLAIFLGEWLYPVIFEVSSGATPGKQIFGLEVLHDDGTPVGWTASVLRNLVRFADFLPFAFGFGLISMLVHPRFKRLGDLAAGTIVTYRLPPSASVSIPEAEPERPPVPLSVEEQRAVVDYCARRPDWTDSRADELASLAHPLTGATGVESRDRLLAIGNWLTGKG